MSTHPLPHQETTYKTNHTHTKAYTLATRSSRTIPRPPVVILSIFFIGGGFRTSKNRNRQKPAPRASHVKGKKIVVSKNPATSSMTISLASPLPKIHWALHDDQIANPTIIAMDMILYQVPSATIAKYSGSAPNVPKVPGIPGNRPAPNQMDRTRATLSARRTRLNAFTDSRLSD